MLNQISIFEDQDFCSQLGFFSSNFGCSQQLPSPDHAHQMKLCESAAISSFKQSEDVSFHFAESQLLSLQGSRANLWAWGEMNDYRRGDQKYVGVASMKMKKVMKSRRKVREPRFCFKTLSDVDVLDDGYKWRKYGQKVVKNTQHPRSYYRCTQDNCRVKKRVERLAEDPRMVITTYEGRHIHTPSRDEEESHPNSSQINPFFW